MSKLVSHEKNVAVFTEVLRYETFKEKLQDAYNKNKGRFNIAGFRKGKAPRAIIEANYGKEIFWNDAIDLVLPEMYEKAIEELGLSPVSKPQIDIEEEIKEGKDIEIRFEVETFPEIELADYSNIEVEELEKEVSEELVDAKIQEEIEKNKVVKPVDREVIEGDQVNIDFEGFKDGKSFEGGKAEGYDLVIGSGQFIPGFEKELEGKNKGEEIEFDITFPEDYGVEELKGQMVTFKVKINEVKEEVYPELDEEFVMDVSEFDTVDEYKDSIRKELEENLKKENELALENAVIDEVISRTEFDVPKQMVEDQLKVEYKEYEHQISQMGMDMDTFFQLSGSSKEEVMEQLRERAENKVKIEVILDKMVEEKNYEVSDEDVSAEYEKVAVDYNREGDEEFIKLIKSQISEKAIKNVLKRRRVIDELKENVVFVEAKEESEDKE